MGTVEREGEREREQGVNERLVKFMRVYIIIVSNVIITVCVVSHADQPRCRSYSS